jgi:hypothetical protein
MTTNLAWLKYLLVGIAYTIFVLWLSFTKNEVRIFSKQNVMPRSTIIVVHLLFLALIFSFMPLISRIEVTLPHWMTMEEGDWPEWITLGEGHGAGLGEGQIDSIFGGMLLLAAFILRYIERRYIYAEVETEPDDC